MMAEDGWSARGETRLLGVDLGDKRTGLAVGDMETGIVAPVGLLEHPMRGTDDGAALLFAIERAVCTYDIDGVVLGLPLHMDGTVGRRAELVRAFGGRLEGALDVPISYQDERLTSVDADWAMAGTGLTHKQKKGRRDALAAAALLRDFMGL